MPERPISDWSDDELRDLPIGLAVSVKGLAAEVLRLRAVVEHMLAHDAGPLVVELEERAEKAEADLAAARAEAEEHKLREAQRLADWREQRDRCDELHRQVQRETEPATSETQPTAKPQDAYRRTEHHLKCWPRYFEAVKIDLKTFEIRKDDRGFRAGDLLVLHEWCPDSADYTAADPLYRLVEYMWREVPGVMPGHVVMALAHPQRAEVQRETPDE